MITIYGRVSFTDRFNGFACQFGQWQKTDNPWVWEAPIVFSFNDNMPATAEFIFPMPYD
jgi:hypothetical protein